MINMCIPKCLLGDFQVVCKQLKRKTNIIEMYCNLPVDSSYVQLSSDGSFSPAEVKA